MKKLDKLIYTIIVFALGAMFYGFFGAAAEASGNRSDGNVGGEALILPLILILIALGYQIRASIKK